MKTSHSPSWHQGPAPAYHAVDTLTVTGIVLVAILTALFVVSYPVLAGGSAALLVVAALIFRSLTR